MACADTGRRRRRCGRNNTLLRFVNPLRAGHRIPRYTKSRSTRSPEGHEVDCASESQPCSLKTMNGLLEKPWSNTQPTLEPDPILNFDTSGDLSHLPLDAACGRSEAQRILRSRPAVGANGSSQSVPDPFAPNPNDINPLNGRTEWGPVMSESLDVFTYYEYHLLSVEKHRSVSIRELLLIAPSELKGRKPS